MPSSSTIRTVGIGTSERRRADRWRTSRRWTVTNDAPSRATMQREWPRSATMKGVIAPTESTAAVGRGDQPQRHPVGCRWPTSTMPRPCCCRCLHPDHRRVRRLGRHDRAARRAGQLRVGGRPAQLRQAHPDDLAAKILGAGGILFGGGRLQGACGASENRHVVLDGSERLGGPLGSHPGGVEKRTQTAPVQRIVARFPS